MKFITVASLCMLAFGAQTFALEKKEISFTGQPGEQFQLEKDQAEAQVEVSFNDVAQTNFNLGLGFRVEPNGDVTDQVAPNTGTNFLVLRKKVAKIIESTNSVNSKIQFTYTLLSREDSLRPIKEEMKITHLNEFWLSFIVGKTALATKMRIAIKKGSKTLISKVLELSEMEIKPQVYGNFVSLNLKELGVEVRPGEKLDVELTVAVVAPGAINLDKDKLEKMQEFKALVVQ